MSPRDLDPPKRHTGELYDAIWELDVPTIPNKPTEKNPNPTGVAVAPPAIRLVLMAMAKHTNPHRDKGQWRCCPTVERLAKLADVSDRQVQRVLAVFVDLGYIEIERQGLRAGRGRDATPTWWRLRPDLWRTRELNGNGGVAHVVTIADSELVASHAPMVVTPASRPVNRADAGDREMTMVATPASPKPGSPVKPGITELNPENEPALAHARARTDVANGKDQSSIDDLKTEDRRDTGFQMALPGQAAVGVSGFTASLAAAAPGVDALEAGRRIWGAARQQLLRPGTGVDSAVVARARNTGTAGYNPADGVLMLDGDLVAEDLQPGSLIVDAVTVAAGGRRLQLCLVGGTPPPQLSTRPAQPAHGERPVDSGAHDAAAMQLVRLRETLSAEDLARLDELERQRVAYAEQPVVPAATDQVANAETEHSRTEAVEREIGERKDVDEAPRRRRRKKEPAVA